MITVTDQLLANLKKAYGHNDAEQKPDWLAETHPAEPEPPEPAIPLPRSWPKAELEELWPTLPTWAQEIIVRRDKDNERELRRIQCEFDKLQGRQFDYIKLGGKRRRPCFAIAEI